MSSENNRRIIKNTLVLYLRMIVVMVVGLYTSRIVLNTLGENDFGIYNVVGGIIILFTTLNATMAMATQRFLSFDLGGSTQNCASTFATSVRIHYLLAAIIFVLAETVGLWFVSTQLNIPPESAIAVQYVYQATIASALISMTQVPYTAMVIAKESMNAYAYISIVETALKLSIVLLLTILPGNKLISYAILLTAVSLCVRVIYNIYVKRRYEECRTPAKFDREKMKHMFAFAGWNMFGTLSWQSKVQGLNVLINIFFNTTVNAALGIANQVASAATSFTSNFQTALNPQITKAYAAEDFGRLHMLIYKGSKFSFFMMLTIALPLVLEIDSVLGWWLVSVPPYTADFCRLMFVDALLGSLSGPLITGLMATGDIRKYQIYVGSIAMLNIPIVYLVLRSGYCAQMPQVAIVISILIMGCAFICRLWMSRQMIRLSMRRYLFHVTIPTTIVLIVAPILPLLIHLQISHPIVRFFAVGTACVVSMGTTIYLLGLTSGEQEEIKKFINSKFPKR